MEEEWRLWPFNSGLVEARRRPVIEETERDSQTEFISNPSQNECRCFSLGGQAGSEAEIKNYKKSLDDTLFVH